MADSASEYGDSDFLADNDRSKRDFRENEKASKKHIVKQMVKLRHNLQYNKHLLSVYLKAKTIFDEMVEEHRAQIHHLDEIYRHLSKLIHTELTRHKSSKKRRDDGGGGVMDNKPMIKELVKDKRKIGKLLSNMRKGLDKLMEIDTIIGTTVDKINEIQFIEDNDGADEDDEDEASEEDDADDAEDDSASEDDDDDDDAEEDSASDEAEEDEEEDDDDDDEVDEDSASEAEEEDDDEDAEDESEASEEDDDEDDEDDEDESEDSEDEDDAEEDEEPVVFY